MVFYLVKDSYFRHLGLSERTNQSDSYELATARMALQTLIGRNLGIWETLLWAWVYK